MIEKNQWQMKLNDYVTFQSGSKENKKGQGKLFRSIRTGLFKCHNCRKPGHKRSECKYKNQDYEVKQERLEEEHLALPVFTTDSKNSSDVNNN